MKISLKCFIIIFFMVLLPFVSKAAGPAGYVKGLDPVKKNELIASLERLRILRGTQDHQVENAISEYLFRYRSLLKTDIQDIPNNKAVDTVICLMMYHGHWEFQPHMIYNRCKEFIKIP